MSLPNAGMTFTPFDPLPASDLNDLVENIEALADGSGLDDGAVTNAKLATGAGQPGGAWTSWTPTLGNITVGSGTLACRYTRVGNTIYGIFYFKYGSGSSIGSGLTFTLPVTASAAHGAIDRYVIGQGVLNDNGGPVYAGVAVTNASTTVANILREDAAGTSSNYQGVTASLPMTWTTNDSIAIPFTYEAA